MSRDRDSSDRHDDAKPERQDEDDRALLSAYVDGVTELTPDDRRRIEAQLASDPAVRADEAATRALLVRLRALPGEGDEPDWSAMERSIRATVGDEVPRPWWRAWRWLVPVMSCATAAAVMVMLWPRPRVHREPAAPPPIARSPELPAPEGSDDSRAIVPLWLDGAEVDVDLSAAEMLRVPGIGDDELPGGGDGDDLALLPAGNLGWVDHLDEAAMARAERWLSAGAGDTGGGGSPESPARKKS